MKQLVIFDNGGETYDRYTILDLKSGDMYGASENPFHPLGFGQYCGSPAHTFFCQTIGAGYISRMAEKDPNHYRRIIKRKTAEIAQEFKEAGNIGQVIDFAALPEQVQQYCKQINEAVSA